MKPRTGQRGITLIEALVALGVMAFGMLAIAGIQSNLRRASDISKQRGEALRLAQAMVEDSRAFTVLGTSAVAGQVGYADLTSGTLSDVVGGNATFTRIFAVSNAPAGRVKALSATVGWTDRSGQAQSIRISTFIAGTLPELAGTLGTSSGGGPLRRPAGRHAAIPRTAVDQGNGTSTFSPPGGGTVSWTFDNTSGAITQTCTAPGSCTAVSAYLLSGYVRFATTAAQPTPVDAETPPSAALAGITVSVAQTAPSSGTVACFVQGAAAYVGYYCAMVAGGSSPPKWSGRANLGGLALAASIGDPSNAVYRVCRYTSDRAHTVVVDGVASIINEDHPLDYSGVKGSLTNQNFLVIKAGDGVGAFNCPDDDTSTPYVRGTTWHHQPSS